MSATDAGKNVAIETEDWHPTVRLRFRCYHECDADQNVRVRRILQQKWMSSKGREMWCDVEEVDQGE